MPHFCFIFCQEKMGRMVNREKIVFFVDLDSQLMTWHGKRGQGQITSPQV